MDLQQTAQSLLDSFPDQDQLLEFDTFLIGDAAESLIKEIDNKNRFFIFDFKKEEKSEIELEDDLVEFVSEPVYVEDVEKIFYDIKKEIFERFGFLKRKSEQFSGQLFLEKDLIISEDDQYLIEYLSNNFLNEEALTNSLAQLCAYRELGFSRVKFYSVDDCPICNAFDGNVFVVEELIQKFCVKDFFSHIFSPCIFVPIIEDRKNSSKYLDIDLAKVFVNETLVENFPVEYTSELTKILEKSKYTKIVFCDFRKFEDVTNEIVIEVGEKLYVDNKYCGNYSPVDLLKVWLSDKEENIVEKLEGNTEEVYYLNGKRVKKTSQGFVEI